VSRRPSFQFYPADWMANKNLRRCTMAERGAWMDIMCMLHDSDEYGILRWTLADLAQAINAPVSLVVELYRKDVLKGVPCKIDIALLLSGGMPVGDAVAGEDPTSAFISRADLPLVHVPNHGGRRGDPVTLLPEQDGPIWFSSRMVFDEHFRMSRAASGPKSAENPNTPRKIEKKTDDTAAIKKVAPVKDVVPVVAKQTPRAEPLPVSAVAEQQTLDGLDVDQQPAPVDKPDDATAVSESTAKATVKQAAKPADKTAKVEDAALCWDAYYSSFQSRYGVGPARDAIANTAIRKAIDSLGKEVAPKVLSYYLTTNDPYIVKNAHSLGLFMRSMNKYYTDYLRLSKGLSSATGLVTRETMREAQAGMHHGLSSKNYREGVNPATGQLTD